MEENRVHRCFATLFLQGPRRERKWCRRSLRDVDEDVDWKMDHKSERLYVLQPPLALRIAAGELARIGCLAILLAYEDEHFFCFAAYLVMDEQVGYNSEPLYLLQPPVALRISAGELARIDRLAIFVGTVRGEEDRQDMLFARGSGLKDTKDNTPCQFASQQSES